MTRLRALPIVAVLLVAGCSPVGAPVAAIASPTAPPRATLSPTATPSPTPTVATPAPAPTVGTPSRAAAESVATPAPTPTPRTPAPVPTAPPASGPLPEAAHDAAGLTAQIVQVEAKLRDPSLGLDEVEYWGHFEQLVISTLADFADYQPQALAALPQPQRSTVAQAFEASKQLRTMHGIVPRQFPNWEIRKQKPIETLLGYYREAEAKYGVPWYYLASIHLVESRMGRIHGLSTSGAQGPMQFMPATWAYYGSGDVNDDRDAIMAAANYLRASGAPGNMDKAIYAYNHSWGYVGAIKAYAEAMRIDQNAYRGYWGWQVYYTTQDGTFLLPVGWSKE